MNFSNFKKLWIGIIFITVCILGGCVQKTNDVQLKDTSKQTSTTPAKEDPKKEEPKKETEKTYKVGDTITVNNKYELTITNISLTNDRNQFSEKKVEKVAVIEFTYSNKADEDLFISSMSFKAYDEEGNVLESYPAGVSKIPQTIGKGKKCTAQMSFGFNKGNKIELDYYDNMFNNKADAKFILEIK